MYLAYEYRKRGLLTAVRMRAVVSIQTKDCTLMFMLYKL